MTFRITLRSQPKSATTADARTVDDNIRLRQLLKVALRRFGFKCVNIERVDSGDEKKEGTLNGGLSLGGM